MNTSSGCGLVREPGTLPPELPRPCVRSLLRSLLWWGPARYVGFQDHVPYPPFFCYLYLLGAVRLSSHLPCYLFFSGRCQAALAVGFLYFATSFAESIVSKSNGVTKFLSAGCSCTLWPCTVFGMGCIGPPAGAPRDLGLAVSWSQVLPSCVAMMWVAFATRISIT